MKPFTKKQIKNSFDRLEEALQNILLDRYEDKPSKGSSYEFMMMQIDKDGTVGFKHNESRNYVFLLPDGNLYIPKLDEPFNRGFF